MKPGTKTVCRHEDVLHNLRMYASAKRQCSEAAWIAYIHDCSLAEAKRIIDEARKWNEQPTERA